MVKPLTDNVDGLCPWIFTLYLHRQPVVGLGVGVKMCSAHNAAECSVHVGCNAEYVVPPWFAVGWRGYLLATEHKGCAFLLA